MLTENSLNLTKTSGDSTAIITDVGQTYGGYSVFLVTGDATWEFSSCCFIPGTQVAYDLNGNTKAIETFAEGDDVVSYNAETEEKYISKLRKLIINENTTDIAKVTFANGSIITMNAYHPIYCEDGWHSITQYNDCPELCVGNVAKTFDGWSEVVSIERYTSEPIVTYNLDVQDENECANGIDDDINDNFFANGVCVHNGGCK